MPDASGAAEKDGEAGSPDPDPVGLNRWERGAAGLIGATLAGFGVWAVFVVDSEVGPLALVLVAAIFLLISVQGTAIRRANRDSVELDPRASPRQIAREAREVLNEQGPEEAEAFIEGASRADPKLANSRVFLSTQEQVQSALEYERMVAEKLHSVLFQRARLVDGRGFDDGYDFSIVPLNPREPLALCYLKYSYGVQTGAMRNIRYMMQKLQKSEFPALVITNSDVRLRIMQEQLFNGIKSAQRIVVVTWRSSDDDEDLIRALDEVLQPQED